MRRVLPSWARERVWGAKRSNRAKPETNFMDESGERMARKGLERLLKAMKF